MEHLLIYPFEEIPPEGSTIPSTYLPISHYHHDPMLPDGSQYYQQQISNLNNLEDNDNNNNVTTYYPKAKRNLSSTSAATSLSKVSSKPSYNVSLKKRYSVVSKNYKAPKGAKLQPKKSLDIDNVCTLITKKLESEENLIGYPKLTCGRPQQYLTDILTCFDSQSIETLQEDCHKIETVFLNCSKIDGETRTNNLNILANLYQLVSCGGGAEWKPREKVVHYITHYLCKNSYLLSQLVYIITDSEDLDTCIYAIKILHELLVRSDRFDKENRSSMIKILTCPAILKTLIESMHFIDLRFFDDSNYLQALQKLHSQILQIITTICKTNSSREQLKHASECTVKLIGKLTSIYYKNRDLAYSLLDALKVITLRRKNCKHLISKRFFDGLCYSCHLTSKLFSTTKVLEAMSKNKSAVEYMCENRKLINLILNLIFYNGKKTINKHSLFTTLYRIVNTENGFKLFSSSEMFDKLYQHFIKNEKHNCRSVTIKAYTILNRIGNVKILQIMKLHRGIYLPVEAQNFSEMENVVHETDSENNSEEESENEDDNESAISGDNMSRIEHEEQQQEPLSNMCPFYVEQLLSTGEKHYSNIYEFNIYEGVLHVFSKKVIENRIHRGINMQAYPDALMLEPEFDDHTFSLSVNHFSIKKLVHKLKCMQGIHTNLYSPRVVYDLDELQGNFKQSTIIPHPSTYSYNPKKMEERPQTSKRSLNFESRFECGNLRRAIQIGKHEYELHLSPDTNTTKGFRWFYFQVTNMIPKVYYTFNIANFLAFDSQYNYGMQPLMFSVIDHTLNKTGWRRAGKEIIYYGNNYINETGSKQYKTLSFSVSFVYSNDYVYFAYHYPYTYTRLMIKLYPLIKHRTKHVYARIDKLCKTVNNKNEVALVTITGAWNRPGSLGIPLTSRPIIFITGRIHPGETNSSWIIEGMIKFLLRETDPNAIKAREHFIFKIIPMLNPEGVIYGNNKCGLTGTDLNKCWIKPNKITSPEIYYAKRLIACAKRVLNLPIAACLDVHGHNKKKFFFLTGCNPMESWNKKDRANKEDFNEILKLLPEMIQCTNPNISLTHCKNKITKEMENSGRVVMWREFDIKHSFTLECSFSFANDIQSMNTKILTNIGTSIVSSLGKIAEKVYLSEKSIPNLLLDYSNVSGFRKIKHLKNKKANAATSLSDDSQDFEESNSDSLQ